MSSALLLLLLYIRERSPFPVVADAYTQTHIFSSDSDTHSTAKQPKHNKHPLAYTLTLLCCYHL